MYRTRVILPLAVVLASALSVTAASASSQHQITRRIRGMGAWLLDNPKGARQSTYWFLNRPAQGCQPRVTGSGRQLIDFWERANRLTLLHFRGGVVSPASVAVDAKVTRYGTVTDHLSELPFPCSGDRGRPRGDETLGQPDPKWTGSEHVSSGGQPTCGSVRGTMDLHFALHGRQLHMSGEFHTDNPLPLAQCPLFGGGVPPLNEFLFKLLPIDLPIDGDVFNPKDQWLGVNVQSRGRPGAGLQPLDQPLLRSYPGDPHGSTIEDVLMNLQTWPPPIGG